MPTLKPRSAGWSAREYKRIAAYQAARARPAPCWRAAAWSAPPSSSKPAFGQGASDEQIPRSPPDPRHCIG
jgi:hypothetical protein